MSVSARYFQSNHLFLILTATYTKIVYSWVLNENWSWTERVLPLEDQVSAQAHTDLSFPEFGKALEGAVLKEKKLALYLQENTSQPPHGEEPLPPAFPFLSSMVF